MKEQFTFFWGIKQDYGEFSQWYRCKFKVDGVEYNCAEQYMMAEKARLFGDENVLKKIMASHDPREQKQCGREVKNFVESKWNKVAKEVVYKGNYAKFTQNKRLLNKLLTTVGTTLVEASPHDRIWGIGLSKDDNKAYNRDTWNGKNWLGEVLTKLRNDLTEPKGK